MPEEKFKVGDVVILKSGGPKMTVEDVEARDTIVCQWFVDGKKLEYGPSPQILSNVLTQARGSLRGSALMVSWRSVRRGRKPQLAQPIRNQANTFFSLM